jgi:exopolysaccharide biosynthesis operon protein EpsL
MRVQGWAKGICGENSLHADRGCGIELTVLEQLRRFLLYDLCAALCALAAVWAAQPLDAAAQIPPTLQTVPSQQFPLSLILGHSVTWDANVFRVPNSVNNPDISNGKAGRSDKFTTTIIGMKFEKLYSLQRFELDVAEVATRYEKFNSLDRNAFNYRGAWQWQLSPRVGGVFSADHVQTVVGFADLALGQQQSQTTIDNRIATVDASLFGGWHLLAGAFNTQRQNSVPFQAVPNVDQNTGELGLRYITEAQNSIAFVARARRGVVPGQAVDFVNFLDNAFTVRESEVNGTWAVSGKSSLIGRLSQIEYHYENIPQRDFSGTAGELRFVWTPSGRLTLTASALRAVLPWTPDTSTSYRVENTYTLAPTWQISDKTRLRASASRLETNYGCRTAAWSSAQTGSAFDGPPTNPRTILTIPSSGCTPR